MAIEALARSSRAAMIVTMVVLGQLMSAAAAADLPAMSGVNDAPLDVRTTRDVAAGNAADAKPGTVRQLWLPQTRSDWDEIVAVARVNPVRPASAAFDGLEEVVVTAPEDLLPMPGVYEQMWGGVLTPFWAVLHPTQAWRIFLPIPPR